MKNKFLVFFIFISLKSFSQSQENLQMELFGVKDFRTSDSFWTIEKYYEIIDSIIQSEKDSLVKQKLSLLHSKIENYYFEASLIDKIKKNLIDKNEIIKINSTILSESENNLKKCPLVFLEIENDKIYEEKKGINYLKKDIETKLKEDFKLLSEFQVELQNESKFNEVKVYFNVMVRPLWGSIIYNNYFFKRVSYIKNISEDIAKMYKYKKDSAIFSTDANLIVSRYIEKSYQTVNKLDDLSQSANEIENMFIANQEEYAKTANILIPFYDKENKRLTEENKRLTEENKRLTEELERVKKDYEAIKLVLRWINGE